MTRESLHVLQAQARDLLDRFLIWHLPKRVALKPELYFHVHLVTNELPFCLKVFPRRPEDLAPLSSVIMDTMPDYHWMLKIISTPPASGRNRFYVSNREPLLPNPLVKLPVGSVRPKGWLRQQLLLMADGMIGHLPETSQWCQFKGSAWASAEGQGDYGREEVPYWLRGFGDVGYVLGDRRIIAETRSWIEAVLSSQEPDGYFGPRVNKENNDLWPNMLMLDVLKSFHEATGDSRVIPFVTKYFEWQYSLPKESLLPGSWQKVRGGDDLHSIYWLYNHTEEKWLLELATSVHERTADWTGGIASWHGVNICEGFREPAQFYQQSHDPSHLGATERNYEEVMRTYGQVPGGVFGADENARPGFVDPRQGAETCSMVEFMRSNEILLSITGNPIYADRCEEIAFDSFPASMSADLKSLHYLTAPNMIQLDRGDKSPMLQNSGTQLSYETMLSNDPRLYRCCMHNVGMGWPYHAEHLWMATQDNGLAAVLYAASEIEARVGDGTIVKIVEDTGYPFDETVNFTVLTPTPMAFPLFLRIPEWCSEPRISINGHTEAVRPCPLKYVLIEREWHEGDEVRLVLPMEVRLAVWSDNGNSVSVRRGPLTYSLRIEEKWVNHGDNDRWPSYEVCPSSPWNYGLVVDSGDLGRAFSVVKKGMPKSEEPFSPDAAPVQLSVRAKRLTQWRQEENGLVGPLPDSPARSGEPTETITLIPMGCARLRIAAFPTVD
jgi:hypothetical protein